MADFYRVPRNPIHFPNLNGLRFLAAALVIVHHIEQVRNMMGLPNHWTATCIQRFGEQGVTLFFVLSGFLITYLLLAEQEACGSIDTGKFYIRRILRIWPLYYAVVVLALAIMPHLPFFALPGLSASALDHLGPKLALFGLILPNAELVLYGAVPYLSQAWSIGTEEQFYLFWPWLVKWARRSTLLRLVVIAIFFIVLKRLIAAGYHAAGPTPGMVISFCYNILYLFRIECMAIGAVVAALLYLRYEQVLRLLMHPVVQWVTLLATVALLGSGLYLPLHQEVYSLLFAVLILNLAAARRPIISLEYGWMNFLGRISYGLYMLHMIAVVTVVRLLASQFDALGSVAGWLATLVTVLLLSAALASASYYGLEKPFLQLKGAFMRVRSQPTADSADDAPDPSVARTT